MNFILSERAASGLRTLLDAGQGQGGGGARGGFSGQRVGVVYRGSSAGITVAGRTLYAGTVYALSDAGTLEAISDAEAVYCANAHAYGLLPASGYYVGVQQGEHDGKPIWLVAGPTRAVTVLTGVACVLGVLTETTTTVYDLGPPS